MSGKMFKTLESFCDHGGDLTSCIREETLLLHSTSGAIKNTLEARITASIELPDGTKFHAEKTIKVRFTKEAKEGQ